MLNASSQTYFDDNGELVDWDNYSYGSGNSYQNYNFTTRFTESEPWKGRLYRAVVPIMILFCVVAVITNLSILIAVRWIRRNLSPTLCFSVSLAVADAYASLVVGLGLLINSLLPIGYNITVNSICHILILEGFRLGGLIVSILHLLLLAVNHYIGIIRPLHYASTMTRSKAMLNITVMWITPIIFFFVYFGSVTDQGFQSEQCQNFEFIVKYEFRYITGCLFFIPLILMFFMYVHIFIIVIRHNRGLSQYQGSRNFKHNVKAATTTLLILGTYTVGWMPAVVFYIIVCLDCAVDLTNVDPTVMVSVNMITNTLIILKLTVNPIIYAARMKEISGAMKRMSSFCLSSSGTVNGVRGRSEGGLTDDVSHSSFIRSTRNGTTYTTIKMQSVSSGGRSCKTTNKKIDEVSPILVYQKCNKNNGGELNKPNNNCMTKSISNGMKDKTANSKDEITSFATSPTTTNTCLLLLDQSLP